MTSTQTRHQKIRAVLDQHAARKLTDLELVQHLAWVIRTTPCECLTCSD